MKRKGFLNLLAWKQLFPYMLFLSSMERHSSHKHLWALHFVVFRKKGIWGSVWISENTFFFFFLTVKVTVHWQFVHRVYGVSILGDIQKLLGHGTRQPALVGPAWAGRLDSMTSSGPFQPLPLCKKILAQVYLFHTGLIQDSSPTLQNHPHFENYQSF